MRTIIEQLVESALASAVEAGELALVYTPEPAVERPRDATHGDWATTIALRLAKELGRKPREIAEIIARHIERDKRIAAVEVAGPGFINLRLSPAALQQVIRDAYEQASDFARVDIGAGQKVNVEFVSANPTGPMHVGHGRWAVLGNALGKVLEHAGWQVTREFYINDAGVQMEVFGASVLLRYQELCGERIDIPEAFYGGSYVIDIAQHILDEEGEVWMDVPDAADSDTAVHGSADPDTDVSDTVVPDVAAPDAAVPDTAAPDVLAVPDARTRLEHFRERGYQLMLEQMQSLCNQIGVSFDVWFSERS
ncbi:MAG: arginine--tRNA ligase, partial [Coriobacteriales bacterium]|nr:arginine--tRNA ligase [Coriobacteriales bacterium]